MSSLHFLLALISMLINDEVNIEGKCSQAVSNLSGMVTHNTRKVKKCTHALNHRHHNLDSICTINEIAYTFPESVVETIKIVLSEGETQAKSFIIDRLILQKTPITKRIKNNKFSLLKHEETSIAVDLRANFMIKLRSAVEYQPLQASEFFNTEIYGVPAYFAENHTDTMFHGTKIQYKTVFKCVSYLIITKTNSEHLLLRHHICCANCQIYLLKLFMTSQLYSTNMLID